MRFASRVGLARGPNDLGQRHAIAFQIPPEYNPDSYSPQMLTSPNRDDRDAIRIVLGQTALGG